MGEAWRIGERPLKGRWVDCNKGGGAVGRPLLVGRQGGGTPPQRQVGCPPPPPRPSCRSSLRRPLGPRRRASVRVAGPCEGKVMLLDAKQAHLHAPAVRGVCVCMIAAWKSATRIPLPVAEVHVRRAGHPATRLL